MSKETIHKFYADSLEQVMHYINEIRDNYKDKGISRTLWFRGQEYAHYNLVPNIFRDAQYKYNSLQTYSNNHLREDYRFQHFMARNYDKTDYREPHSIFEWQEVMQHFFSKTRLMDWSEFLFSALEFALEAYLIPYSNLEISEKRRKIQPTLWVLQPNQLNMQVYDSIVEDRDFPVLKKVMSGMEWSAVCEIGKELRQYKDIYFSLDNVNDHNFSDIVSLTALEALRHSYIGREEEAVRRRELNPFFYIISRIYSDGVPVECKTVPPLAVIHPYHSQRIKAQKGVFTVFPFYILGQTEERIRKMAVNFNPISMEFMPACQPSLYEIQLTNPARIAEQMRTIGCKSSDLYPDTQRVTQDMENMDFSI